MSATLVRGDPERQGFDAEGRHVFAGWADVRRDDDTQVAVRVWCVGADGELSWWLDDGDVSGTHTWTFAPDRTQLLVGSAKGLTVVETATGEVRERGLTTDLHDFGWAADTTLVGMVGQRLVRRTLQGQSRPTWAKRGGIAGMLDVVEPWLTRSDSLLAMMLDGRSPDLVAASDRAIRLGNSATTIAGPDGQLHLVQSGRVKFGKGDDRWAVTWLHFDAQGSVQHRIVVPVASPTDDALLDASGRLWVRASPQGRNVIVRIDPKTETAQIVASAKKLGRIRGFTVDPDGQLRLPTRKKVDTPEGDDARLPFVRRRSRFRPVAIASLLAVTAANVASVPAVLAGRDNLLEQAAAGQALRVKAGKTGHKMLQPQDLEALAPGQLAYATELGVLALGLLLLTLAARTTPARAVSLAVVWVTVIAVVAILINAAVTLRPMGGFDTFTLAGIPGLVHLCTWMGLLFLSAAGPQLVK